MQYAYNQEFILRAPLIYHKKLKFKKEVGIDYIYKSKKISLSSQLAIHKLTRVIYKFIPNS